MVCHEMAFLPPPSSDHHQYFFHHQQQLQDPSPPTPLNMQLSPQHFHGGHMASLTMMNQQRSPAVSGYQQQQQQPHDHDHEHDDLSDDGSHLVLGEKKKRLNIEQVKTLEKNFELGNKLEPERKLQLAKALGLQPRQVAIWFQNRRARWKTKQLEKDYNSLKRQFDALKSHNDSLLSQNKKLQSQLIALKGGGAASKAQEGGEFGTSINLNATTKSYCWSNNGSEISSDINLGMSTTPPSQQPEEISPSTNKIHFPTSFLPTTLTDLLTTSSNSTPKQQSADHQIQDDSFCSLFGGGGGAPGGVSSSAGGVPEQPPFWAWPSDQHHLQ